MRFVALLGLVVLGSTVWAQTPAKLAATVNGEPVPLADLDRVVEMIVKEKFKMQPPTDAQRRQVRMEMLTLLINDLLMKQFLRKQAPPADPVEVDKQFGEFVNNLKTQKPPRTFQEFTQETGQTEPMVRGNIAATLQWIAYVKAAVKDADVERYYAESKDFFDQVAVRASHIVIRTTPETSDGERVQARNKLTALRAELAGGKLEFAEAAKQHSQCPSAPTGGDIGYFSRKGMLDENFARVAYALKVGEISDVVETEFGYHIIKVTDRKAGQPSDYQKIKEEVRDFYIEELRQKLLMQQHKAGKIDIMVP
ncbi:MAG: peptidylprolyl isomerase [Planctomycetia bacterium]|nr:peptidylprolyl isomerase [Planctomycetia bacterium]